MRTILKNNKLFWTVTALTELTGAFLFIQYGYHWLKILRYLCLIGFLAVLGKIDYEKKIIPNKIMAVMLAIRIFLLIGEIICFPVYWKELLLSAAGGFAMGFLIFILAYVFSKKSLGLGDVKLAAVMGWYLGASLIWWDLAVCLFFAAAYSCMQLARKKIKLKDSIPLAPFIMFGTILVLLIGF